ncbi:MAG: hypothetical protein HY645_03335 [Acidobacteria bacterium]|nr:hypothetical protein [Acidobacteriota bacterium]
MERTELIRTFDEKLRQYVFFHLGSDAVVEFEEQAEALKVRLAHRRVEPFEFLLPWDELSSLLDHPRSLEDYLLEQFLSHRR